mgnify:CR=1 FL=1
MKKTVRSAARKTATARKAAVSTADQVVTAQNAPSEPDRVARQFGLQTILSRPLYLAQSNWLEHIPFAFWLMEALKPSGFVELGSDCGASYFAFCQAAARLEIDIDSYAIGDWPDTPEGRAHFNALSQYNEGHYAAFSRIKRGKSKEEAKREVDEFIDVMEQHIDNEPQPEKW